MTTVSIYQPISEDVERTLEDVLADQAQSVEDTAVNRIYASEMLGQIWPLLTNKRKEALLAKAHYEDAWKQAAKSLNIRPQTYLQRIWTARLLIKEDFVERHPQQGA